MQDKAKLTASCVNVKGQTYEISITNGGNMFFGAFAYNYALKVVNNLRTCN